jgi:hypothetical protein
MKSTGYASQGCDPFFFVGRIPQIAPMIAPMIGFARAFTQCGVHAQRQLVEDPKLDATRPALPKK